MRWTPGGSGDGKDIESEITLDDASMRDWRWVPILQWDGDPYVSAYAEMILRISMLVASEFSLVTEALRKAR